MPLLTHKLTFRLLAQLQVPLFSLPALGEIFVNVTSYELAYTRAPPRMKGLVYAFCLFTTAISSAIGLACSAAVSEYQFSRRPAQKTALTVSSVCSRSLPRRALLGLGRS